MVFYIPCLTGNVTLSYTFQRKWYPFHIPNGYIIDTIFFRWVCSDSPYSPLQIVPSPPPRPRQIPCDKSSFANFTRHNSRSLICCNTFSIQYTRTLNNRHLTRTCGNIDYQEQLQTQSKRSRPHPQGKHSPKRDEISTTCTRVILLSLSVYFVNLIILFIQRIFIFIIAYS